MRKISYKLMLSCTMILLSLAAFSQNVITGKVSDSKDGTPVAGATVTVKGTKTAVQTGSDGTFKINAPASATLVFSSIGFGQQEVSAAGSVVNVNFVKLNQNLDELIVVAYGTKRKGDLTGSVTSVSAKDFQKGVVNSSEQLLQGKVAGLEVTTGGGSPGGGSRIRIRGGASLSASNDPLIVIDGVPVEGNGLPGSSNLLNTINPNDIESMSVLKDASATALYGSRASNGVLIITTKKGSKGKIRYNYSTQLSTGIVGKTVNVLSGDEVRAIINADAAKTGNNTYKNLLGTANTDWQKEIYHAAFGWDNNISASGAVQNIPFRASIGYLNQDGILRTDNFKRFTGSLNLSPKFLDDHLSVNVALKVSNTKNNFADGGAIGSAIAYDPTQTVNSSTNKFGGYREWLDPNGTLIDLATRNPVALLNQRDNKSNVNRFIGNVQLDYKIHWFPDLHVLFNLGVDNSKGSGDDNIDSASATNYKTGGRKTHYEQKKTSTISDIQLFYAKDLKKLKTKVDVLVGHSYQDFVTDFSSLPSFSYRAIADPLHPEKKDTIAGSGDVGTGKPEWRLESYLGRVNISVANKYLITASLRRDASSRFSKDNRVGYFPAVAAAWKLKEDFFKNVNVLTDLKLRLGWGSTGNQDGIDYYSYLPYYSQSNSAAQYQFGNTYYGFLRPSAYDPTRKWETTTTSNLGLDFGFLNNRISGSVDYYFKKTKDLLSVVPVAAGANFNIELLTNVGNMENKGVEFTINTTPVKKKNLQWDFGFNFTYNTREVTNLLKQQDANFTGIPVSGISGGTGNNIGRLAVGYSPYVFYVFKQVYDPNSGKPIEGLYEDLNRDGVIDQKDRYFYKKPASDIFIGLNTQVSYKKYSLGIAGHGAFGNYLYNNFNSNNGVLRSIKNPINFIGNASANYKETNFLNNQYLSDYYIENASFFRLDNINLGYNWGKILKGKASLRIAASVQNVFVITKYNGLDPENASDSGVDNNIYPRPRTFSLGFNLDF